MHQNADWGNWNTDLVFDKTDDDIFYVGGYEIWKMTIKPTGITSSEITDFVTGVTNDTLVKCVIDIADNYPGKVWFYYNRNNTLHLSKYESSSYTYLSSIENSAFTTMAISASEVNSDLVYLGQVVPRAYDESVNDDYAISDNGLDGSESATDTSDYLHSDIRDMEVLVVGGEDYLYVGHDGGVAWGDDDSYPGEKFGWHQISDDGQDGLQTNEFYGISISNSNPINIQGGTQDCSSFFFDESSDKWYHVGSSDGTEGAVSQSDPDRFIVGSGVSNVSYYAYDKDDTNYRKYHCSQLGGSLNNRVKTDPKSSSTLYFGGSTFTKVISSYTSSPLRVNISTPASDIITAFAIGNNSSALYVAERIIDPVSNTNHMWRYNPSSDTWTDISSDLDEYINSFATDIVLHPNDDDEVYVCMGQTTNENKKVFRSTNGGVDWECLCDGYPSGIPANRLLLDKISNILYVATDVGIFTWDLYDSNAQWEYISDTMPFKLVLDIERDYVGNRLFLGTYGRGIWEGTLPDDECFDETPLNITNTVSWGGTQTICKNVNVKNGGTINLSGFITLSKGVTLTIEDGGEVSIYGGHLINGNSIVNDGGILTISSGGSIDLFGGDELILEPGSDLDISDGAINKLE